MMMKILDIIWTDCNATGDDLNHDKSFEFVSGGYTHVNFKGEIMECSFILDANGCPIVRIGRQV